MWVVPNNYVLRGWLQLRRALAKMQGSDLGLEMDARKTRKLEPVRRAPKREVGIR